MKILIFHNLLWSRYKADVFSNIASLLNSSSFNKIHVKIIQISETDLERKSLGDVDLSIHKYPYELLFKGAYNNLSKYKICIKCFHSTFFSDADLILIPGFDKFEYWFILLASFLRYKKIGLFCDSTLNDRKRSTIKMLAKKLFIFFCHGFFCYGQRSKEYLLSLGAKRNLFIRCQASFIPENYRQLDILTKRSSYSREINNPRFLYVGRLSPEKDLKTLINAFHNVFLIYPLSELVIIGSGAQLKELQDLTAKLQISKHVKFLGAYNFECLIEEYLKSSCLVLPSVSEPWGLVVNEALLFGCPVIVSDACGCVPELVEDGVSGFAFKSNNISDLTHKLLMIMNLEPFGRLTTTNCLSIISKFTPYEAAKSILIGSKIILNETVDHK